MNIHTTKKGGDLVRVWSGKRAAYWRTNAAGYTTKVSEAGIFRRDDAERRTAGLDDDHRFEFDLVVPLRPYGPPPVAPAKAQADRAGLRDILERGLRSLSLSAELPTGQAAMIEAQTLDQLIEDLGSLRLPATSVRPGHLTEGNPA